jgi:RNA polymerase sigma-70 factor (ECF subfamily)
MIGNHHDTEDVLQNAILRACTKIDQFQENSKLLTWLYRIITNECYRFFEKIDKLPLIRITEDLGMSERTFFEDIHYIPEFDDALIMDEMREKCLQAFLKCMPKNQRICFLLKTCLDLKNQEIGEIMDISADNVKVTLFRARKHLKSLFEMRCSLIDPEKPCKCHLWIKFMKDNHLPIPSGYMQPKTELLKQEYFKNLSLLKKIDYLYTVEAKCDRDDFIKNLKKLTEVL